MTEPLIDSGSGSAATPSAGALLRAARERQGLHIAALAAAIKVSPKKLEALEADRWSDLPDATFTRALAQTVCRTLKIDARIVLDKLPPAGGVNLALTLPSDTETGGAPAGPSAVAAGRTGGGIPGLVWGALLLLVGAGVLVVLPSGWTLRTASPVAASAPAPAPIAASGVPAAAASVALAPEAPASAAFDAAASAPALPGPGPAPGGAPGQQPVGTSGQTPVAMSVPAPPPQASPVTLSAAAALPAAAAGALVLTATQDSWIEVRDASGAVLVSRLLAAGERMGLDGTPPLRATIGNAAGTQLSWRGQSIDIASRQQGNVARVELP